MPDESQETIEMYFPNVESGTVSVGYCTAEIVNHSRSAYYIIERKHSIPVIICDRYVTNNGCARQPALLKVERIETCFDCLDRLLGLRRAFAARPGLIGPLVT